jgi:subtilisin family serine protease
MTYTLAKSFHQVLEHKPLMVILLLALFLPGPLFSQAQQSGTKTIHVKFKEESKPGASVSGRTAHSGVASVDKVSEKHKANNIKRIFPDAGVFEKAHRAYGLHLWYEIELTKDAKVKSAVEDYQATNFFEYVEESRPYSFVDDGSNAPADLPTLPSGANDPLFSDQWHFENNGQMGGTVGADINLLKAWQKETGSPNVIVAVIDGGINVNHPDLQGALWVNADEIPGNGKDDDLNGYVDDVHGYGFGDKSSFIYPDNHATHVAGTIGAVSNNGIGVSGIAGGNGFESGVKLMSCAGFGNFGIGGFEQAMVYAADNGAVISQNSWGGGSNAIEAAINYFISRAGYDNSSANFSKNIQTGPMAGGVVIFAAGNQNTSSTYYGYPASYDKVIAVASTNNKDIKSQFSNFGSWVDISAPGSDVYSALESGYGYLSGTSMACPHVSGVAALIISNLQRVGLKPNEIWNRLRFSSRSLKPTNPILWGYLGWGRLDAFVALMEPDAIPPGAVSDLRVDEIHSTSLILRWTASGESNYEGQAAEYEIRYSTSPIDASNFNDALLVANAPTPPPSGEDVVFDVANLSPVTTYYFALKSIDLFNNISPLSNVVSIKTLKLPTPELVTTQLSGQLHTGRILKRGILIKNVGDDELLVRPGVPHIQAAPVIPPLGATGRLFAINSIRNTIQEINTKTGAVIHSIPMPEPSSKTSEGLAYDGTFLYYGRSKTIYKINAETGVVVRTIDLNATVINGMAWSGRYLYVSQYSQMHGNGMAEVDVDNGAIIRTLGHYTELAFLGNNNTLLKTSNSQLEEISIVNGDFIRSIPAINPKCIAYSFIDNLIFVSDGYSNLIKAIRPTDGEVMYTLPYPTTTALAGDEHAYGWLETKEHVIAIPGGQTGEVPVTFVSAGLNSGTWTGSVNIIPLNSNTSPMSIPVSLNVVAGTDIETANEINFGTKYLGIPIDTTIVVANRGFSNLVIDKIQSNDTKVISSIPSATLSPGQQINLQVRIEPDGAGIINTSITFTSNDPDEGVLSIPVRATILIAPAISVSPDSLKVTLASGESTTVAITLTNTGGSMLHWNANLTGTDSTVVVQSTSVQNDFTPQSDTAAYKNDLGNITMMASSPEPLTCLTYDPNGEVMYAKSHWGNNFYTFDPVLNKWTSIGFTPSDIIGQATYLNGKLYYGGSQLNIYTIQSDAWTSVPFPIPGSAISITSDDKFIYVAIGKILYRFDPVSGNWLELAPVPAPFYLADFGALSYHSGVIYANGIQGFTGDGNTLFFKYFIGSNTWLQSSSISGKLSTGGAVDNSSARYFVVGSPSSNSDNRIQMSILDIRYGSWTKLSMPAPVGARSSLVFVGKRGASGIYFTQGENGNNFGYYETASAPNWFTSSPSRGNLPAGATQTISVHLNAQALFGGVYRGNVKIHSSNPRIEKNVPLELKVLGTSDISFDKVSYDVGNVILGYESGASVRVTNTGSAELVISNISISSPDFKISKTSFAVPVGESTTVTMYFKPTSVGKQTGTFTFHSNDPLKSNLQFELKAAGVHPAQLQVPADTLKVTLSTGGTAKKKFSIQNNGGGGTHYLVVWSVETWIDIDSSGYPVNIGAHQTREFEAIINATGFSQGKYKGSVVVLDHRDPTNAIYYVPVLLEVISAPALALSLDSLNYGDQFINSHYNSTIEIRNEGVLPLAISSIASDNAAFTIFVNAPLNLNPGAKVIAPIRFKPVSIGSQSGSITFTSNDPDQGVLVVKLKGNGIHPPILSTSDSELFVSVFQNESQSEVIQFFNSGGSKLNWRILNESNPKPSAAGDFTHRADVPMEFGNPVKLTAITADPATGVLYGQYLWYQDLYAYNAFTNTWTEVGHTPNGLENTIGGAVVLNSKMYSVYTTDKSTIYIYDMVLKDWTTKPNSLQFASATVTTDGNLLYMAGDGKFASYNPKNNQWNELAIPNFGLDGLGGLNHLNGVIYAHSSNSNGFAKYTIATGVWENLIPLPDKTTLGSTIDPIRKRYYAYGENYLYEYDITENAWTVLFVPLFEIGNNGGMSYLSGQGVEGIYFVQGILEKGFARYEPQNGVAWLRSSQMIGEIKSMDNQSIGINCNAVDLSPGVYHGKIKVTSNDPNNLTFDIPVTFEVKNAAPKIKVSEMIAELFDRVKPSVYYVVIENNGKESLEWNLANALPAWLSVDKSSGNISGYTADSIIVTFTPSLFSNGAIADHTLEINSNDPVTPKSFTAVLLTIQNHPPLLTNVIPKQFFESGQIEIPLLQHFADADNDPLSFSASSSAKSLISASVIGSRLVISPIKKGISTVTIIATDIYNASVATTFEVSNLITGLDPESGLSGLIANPNPFENTIKISFEGYKLGKASFVLVDVTGRAVWRSNEVDLTTQHELEINGHTLSSGLYTCLLFVNDKLTDSIRLLKD